MTTPNPSAPPSEAALILDAPAIERALKRVAHEIIERNPQLERVALIGVPSRGILLATRLAGYIRGFGGVAIPTGVVDVAMHRDDIHMRAQMRPVQATQL